jgi:hypothetical protein
VQQPAEPTDLKGAVTTVKDGIVAAKSGQWWYFSALVLMLAMFVLKKTGALEKMGRWKYIVLPVLALGASLLATFQGGISVEAAVGVFSTSYATGMLQQAWKRGIMGEA